MHWAVTSARRTVTGVGLVVSLTRAALGEPVQEPRPPKATAEAPPSVAPPKLLSDPVIPYPSDGKGRASVILILIIDKDGAVREAHAEKQHPPFSVLAEQHARGFRFEPARRGGAPVAAKIKMLIAFEEPRPEPPPAAGPVLPDPAAAHAEPGGESTAGPVGPATSAGPAASVTRPSLPKSLEVTVVGVEPEPSRSVMFSRAEVRQIPGTFGDPFRAIEAMPGVTPIVSGLPFFFIRGAPPGNVGYFLDGLSVPLLFHVGVGPSVVHPGVVDRVDLYPGGYPARFGRFAGGVVAGETVAPEARLQGEYNLRLFDAGAMVETGFADGRGTALVGGRYSYTAALLSYFSPETTLDYWDYQGRATYDITPRDTVGVFAFGSYDLVSEKTETDALTLFGTEFHRVDLRHDHRMHGEGSLRTALTLGLDRSLAQEDRSVQKRLGGARTDLSVPISKSVRFRGGTDFEVGTYDVVLGTDDLSPSAERAAALFPSRTDLAAAVRGDVVINVDRRLQVTPGVRLDVFTSEGAAGVGIDPRLSVRTRVTRRLDLLTALGIAHQPPAFVVPLPGFQPGGLRGGLQQAIQESFGLELDLGNATTATATVFQNAFFRMSDPLGSTTPITGGCPPGSFPGDTLAGDRGGTAGNPPPCGPRFADGVLGPDRSGGGGQAADSRGGQQRASALEVRTMGSSYGLELFLKRRLTDKLGGFVSYTLSRSTRSYERRHYVATFDRTHVLNAALAYNLGRNWRAGTRAVFYTGLPKAPDPLDPSSTRLPAFFRVDLRLEKRWILGPQTWISAVAEWMNATLSEEAVTTTCTLAGCEAQMIGPITIPSLGVEGGF